MKKSHNIEKLVSYVDTWIGKFLKEINFQNTLLVISSDHGEYIPVTGERITEIPKVQKLIKKGMKTIPFTERLGIKAIINLRFIAQTYRKEILKRTLSPYEMRSFNTRSANALYDETIRVPLIFKGYGVNSQKIVSDLVRTVDIFPTIFEMLGLKNQESDINGRSVLPLIQDKKLEELPANIEVGINLAQLIEKNDHNTVSKVIGIRTSKYKFFKTREKNPKDVHLYDLEKDPLELKNIASDLPNVVEKMNNILIEFESTSDKKPDAMNDEQMKKVRDELMKLGYL